MPEEMMVMGFKLALISRADPKEVAQVDGVISRSNGF